jgi:hypothetical protein
VLAAGETTLLGRKLNSGLFAAVALAALVAGGLIMSNRVSANQCGASCRNAYNQCRISTKGSPSCEAAFTACMQSCIRK